MYVRDQTFLTNIKIKQWKNERVASRIMYSKFSTLGSRCTNLCDVINYQYMALYAWYIQIKCIITIIM